jgi:hypothetical protein
MMVIEKEIITTKLIEKTSSLQFIPKRLDYLLKDKKTPYNGVNLKKTYLVDIVHNLILRYYFRKENIFSLSSLILKEKYGSNYNYYMDFLVKNEIIVLIKDYFVGKNVRVYKLNETVISGEISRFVNRDRILLKKYKSTIESIIENDIKTNRIDPIIKIRLIEDLFSVQIDFEKSMYFLNNTIQDPDVYNKNKYSVESIKDRHIFYHFDSYGRLHTNFTILKSFIRKNCLTINKEETDEIDIKNSQPLFLSKMIDDDSNSNVNTNELNLFKYLTWNGLFYQYIIDNSDISNKKEAKEITYKVIFGKNYSNKYDRLFKNLFPTIYRFIQVYKNKEGDYRVMSHRLQNLESEFVFNKVIKRVYESYPHIKIFTVHDSIIFSRNYQREIKEIFDQEMDIEFIGYKYISVN